MARLGEFLVVVEHKIIVLFIERVDVVFGVTVRADQLHSAAFFLPGVYDQPLALFRIRLLDHFAFGIGVQQQTDRRDDCE